MTRPLLILLCLLALLPATASARLAGPPEVWQQPAEARDLAQIRRSGVLKVLVNQSRNSSGEVKGEQVGVEYHRVRAFEQYLNRNARDGREIKLKLIPKSKDQLLPALQRGEGDLVAPGELMYQGVGTNVSASAPLRKDVPLVLVSRQGQRRYQRLEQLSGRSIALPVGSAAGEALRQVNEKLAGRKLAPIVIEWVDPTLAVEDVLEMVQAGIFPLTAVEQPIAERWAKVMPKLRLDKHLVLDRQGDLTWFVRRDAPTLRASVDRFLAEYRAPDDQDAAFQRVYRRLYKVHNPLARTERQRLERVRPVLQRYADQHDFDWLNLAALAYKESSLNPGARGASGATGLMQITPGAARSVGVGNIQKLDNNVQASAKYLAMLRRNFFASSQLEERERMAFVLAAYNLGPQRVQGMRAEARRRGLNPNQWFFQVERIAAEQAGMGVVSYVNSVNKYYLAFDRERYLLEPSKKVTKARK
ncbi:transglycosylase SLT domain-containing protein [Pseudomonas sp. JM0905a]|uniref:Transglycosylase SLT domain-containing protein n=1 Tax=Metapseudomonas resinovorans TaxID=53412 RepID=A0ABT4YAL8_METRE|nr:MULTISPECIES: transglycosylase SLT domain-containing protein [Pseudomonas]MBD2836403.1 transglycosylase SLT domain-containing protein [Pseudomonas sp. JM0905a]MDA8485816.1 transglycosylase SLT domain-containing protein [Pseudomonas resinovorans]